MSQPTSTQPRPPPAAVAASRGVLVPVTRLVTRLSLAIINGRLTAQPVPLSAR